ncbi:FtsX-like permease family protein [Actinokineospora enzanensis]|uniref:FtsX-like permease family protein n=1 Tax=Actinokineospora enzanensis TaxID=155975 RepID=UPI00035F06B5|nr:FtsX-like permease family protein [Actinokineospora enzanensis]
MFGLAMRTLRFRKGGFLGTFVALFFGAALVLASAGLMETGIRTAVPPQRMTAADLQVVAPQTFEMPREAGSSDDPKIKYETAELTERVRLDRDLVVAARGVSGVRDAVPYVSFPVRVTGSPVSTGLGWDATRVGHYRLDGAEPRAGQVVVAPGMARPGDRVTVVARGSAREFTVSGSADMPGTEAALFFAAADVPALSGQSGVDSVAVVAEPGTDLTGLAERLGHLRPAGELDVLADDDRGLAELPEARTMSTGLIALAGVTGGLAMMVAMFVVASTLGLSVQQRGRELALLRAIGTTPGQLRRMVLSEAMVVAVFATLLGCIPGRFLGKVLYEQLAQRGVVPPEMAFHQGWIPMVITVGAGLLTALGAAYLTARRAGRTRPTEALADAALETRWLSVPRAIIAALAFGGGLALLIVTITVMDGPIAASTAGPSVMLWAIAVALTAPALTKAVLGLVRWPLRAFAGIPGELGLLNARARTVRLAAAVVPIMLAVGVTTANIYLQTTMGQQSREAYAATLRSDAVIASTSGGLPRDLLARARHTPGVTAASELVTSRVFVIDPIPDSSEDDGYPVQGVGGDIAETTALTVTGGSLDRLVGATGAFPDSLELKVGERVRVRLGDGAVQDVTVAATFTGVTGFETVLMPADLVLPHTTNGLPGQILLRGDVSAAAALAASVPGAIVGDRATLTAAFEEKQAVGEWVNYILVGMIMAYTVISVVNTLVMATVKRRREFGLQRLTGSSRGQVLRMMGMEALVIALIGVVLGTLVSAATLVPFTLTSAGTIWPTGPLWVYLSIIGGMSLLVVLATLLPTWTATRTRPVDAASLPD